MPPKKTRRRTTSHRTTSHRTASHCHRWSILALAAALLPVTAFTAERDPKAVELARGVLDAMGGEEAWAATRFIRFNFFGFRLHHWDRHTGRHRWEGKSREGDSYVVLHNVSRLSPSGGTGSRLSPSGGTDTREGTVVVGGETVDGEDKAKWLERAYEAWINDTYWLVMPYKLLDPGVNLELDGSEDLGGETFDKLKLTFEGVGLTPGDTYWAYVNRATGLMERWAYFLQDWEEGREPTHWQWLDWGRYGRIMLSPRRLNPDPENGRETMLSELAVFDHLPDSVFDSPEPVEVD